MIARLQLRNFWNPITNVSPSKEILVDGIFSKIRHPIYLGRFMFFLGVMLMLNFIAVFITPLYWDYLKNKALKEEELLKKRKPYRNYLLRTKRFLI